MTHTGNGAPSQPSGFSYVPAGQRVLPKPHAMFELGTPAMDDVWLKRGRPDLDSLVGSELLYKLGVHNPNYEQFLLERLARDEMRVYHVGQHAAAAAVGLIYAASIPGQALIGRRPADGMQFAQPVGFVDRLELARSALLTDQEATVCINKLLEVIKADCGEFGLEVDQPYLRKLAALALSEQAYLVIQDRSPALLWGSSTRQTA